MPGSTNTVCDSAAQLSEYPCVTYLDDVQLSDGLLSGSLKNAAVIACSEMGGGIPFVCSSPSAQLFLFQNFGHHFETGGVVETIAEEEVKNVVVYGHSNCEHTKFLAESEEGLISEDEDLRRLYATAIESDSEADWKIVGQYNVLNELKKILANPVIATLLANGNLQLHGWFYNSATRQIEVFNQEQKTFITVTK